MNIAKVSILPEANCRFSAIPIKTSIGIVKGSRKRTLLKFIWNQKRLQITKEIPRRRMKQESSEKYVCVLSCFSHVQLFANL